MVWKRIVVAEQERIVLAKNKQFGGILVPGEYRMFVAPGMSLDLERHSVRDLIFRSIWSDYLVQNRPQLADRHFTRVETNDFQIALVYVNRELFKVLTPAKRVLFWRGPTEVTAEFVQVIGERRDQSHEHKRKVKQSGDPSWITRLLHLLRRAK